MKHTWKCIAALLTLGIIIPGCGDEMDSPDVDGSDPDETAASPIDSSRVLHEERRVIAGRSFTFMKFMDASGVPRGAVLDPDGNEIDEADLPRVPVSKIRPGLQAWIDSKKAGGAGRGGDRELVQVTVALTDDPDTDDRPASSSGVLVDDSGRARYTINGVEVDEAKVHAERDAERARLAARRAARIERRRAKLRDLARYSERVAAHPAMIEALEHGRSSVSLPLEAGEVEGFLRAHDPIIAGLELTGTPQDDLDDAMSSTNIDPYALDYGVRQGSGIGIYMSEGNCPPSGHITSYTRLSGTSDDHSENVSAIVRGVSPLSYVYCRDGSQPPLASDLGGTGSNPKVYVETHSWGYYYGGDMVQMNRYSTADRDFDDHVYDSKMAVFKSAGNFNSIKNQGNHISSPGKALNVITVGNYDDDTDDIASSSSYDGWDHGDQKPELSAPGVSIDAGGVTMTGTSQATPHAAGFGADLMGAYAWLKLLPHGLKALMVASANNSIGGGVDKVGSGGLNFYSSYYKWTGKSYSGGNSAFADHDSYDYLPNNGYVDSTVYISSSSSMVRVVLAWLSRGSYTYSVLEDTTLNTKISFDLDLYVYDPNGNHVGSSSSVNGAYEMVSFDPTVSGNYRIAIYKFKSQDSSANLDMAYVVDW